MQFMKALYNRFQLRTPALGNYVYKGTSAENSWLKESSKWHGEIVYRAHVQVLPEGVVPTPLCSKQWPLPMMLVQCAAWRWTTLGWSP